MPLVNIKLVGTLGLVKDISSHELPITNIAWTDAYNIRFLDGVAYQTFGWGEVYDSPSYSPQYVLPVNISSNRYWVYATATKQFSVTYTGGAVVHTDITHVTARAGTANKWTYALLSGLPVLNADDGKVPMYWDLDITHKFVDIPSFGSYATGCKSIRAYKNFLIALNITKAGGNKPFMVKWSNPADPGAMPTSWNEGDATVEAGETDLDGAETPIVDGLKLRDSFIIYTENSTHRMDYIGGDSIFSFRKVFGMSGILGKNCCVEFDGWHFVVTDSDVIIHDGQTSSSVLDKKYRREFFQSIDSDSSNRAKVFVFKNPFLNEIFVAYPSIGSSVCDMAVVYNYVDKTVSKRQIPNLTHANYGAVSAELSGSWAEDSDSWNSDLTLWNGPEYTPDTARVLMASTDQKLYMLDASASFNGTLPSAYLERIGMSFDMPEAMKLIKGIRPRIYGNVGETVIVKVGYSTSPYDTPTYTSSTYTIGSTIANDLFVSGRYLAIRFETGTAAQFRIDSFDIDLDTMGAW
jgi:hypothetical protein